MAAVGSSSASGDAARGWEEREGAGADNIDKDETVAGGGLVHMTDVLRGRKYFRVMLKKRFRIYEPYAASVGQFSHERVFSLSALGQPVVRRGEIASHRVRLSCEQVQPP